MKILVVRVGRLGDMVMITPALDALLEKHPDGHLTLLTSPEGRRVLGDFHPRLDEIWVHERKTLWPFGARARIRRSIRDAGFDDVVLFESNPTYERLVSGAGKRVFRLAERSGTPVAHFARRCLELVDPGGQNRWVRLPVDADARRRAAEHLARAGIDDDDLVVGFHPSFAERARLHGRSGVRRNKTWPVAHWGALARRLTGARDSGGRKVRVVMDVAPEDRGLGEAIVEASDGEATLLTPPPDFPRFKATLARYDLLVAPDTGPMHLAAAVGTPVVALFAGKDPADCGPYTEPGRRAVLRAEDEPSGPPRGLAALEPERVFQACLPLLPSPRPTR